MVDEPGPPAPHHNWPAAAILVVALLVSVVVVGAALHRNEQAGGAGAGVTTGGSSPSTTAQPAMLTGTAGSPTTTALAAWQQQFLACVRQTESRGNYQAVSSTGQAFGAYQITSQTWNNTTEHYGYTSLTGIQPNFASPADQDAVAAALLEWQGTSPWPDGC